VRSRASGGPARPSRSGYAPSGSPAEPWKRRESKPGSDTEARPASCYRDESRDRHKAPPGQMSGIPTPVVRDRCTRTVSYAHARSERPWPDACIRREAGHQPSSRSRPVCAEAVPARALRQGNGPLEPRAAIQWASTGPNRCSRAARGSAPTTRSTSLPSRITTSNGIDWAPNLEASP
jgi:hypothetical protein